MKKENITIQYLYFSCGIYTFILKLNIYYKAISVHHIIKYVIL